MVYEKKKKNIIVVKQPHLFLTLIAADQEG